MRIDRPSTLLERHSEHLLARVRAMLGERARRAAESLDYLHEAWVEFLASPLARTGGDEDDLVRRFCAIARNNVRDACRRAREVGFESVAGSAFSPEAAAQQQSSTGSRVARAELLSRLHRATERLSAQQRRIVELRALEGHSFVEISLQLGLNQDTVRKAYNRALVGLSRPLAADGFAPQSGELSASAST